MCSAPSFPVVFGGGDRGEMGDGEGERGGGEEGLRDLEVRRKEGERRDEGRGEEGGRRGGGGGRERVMSHQPRYM